MKKNFISLSTLLFAFSCIATSQASADFFENNSFSLSQAGGNFATQTSTLLTPKDNKKIFWSFHAQNIASGYVTSEVTRIYVPRSRTLRVFELEEKNSSIEEFNFQIESSKENNFFRVESIDSNPEENFLPTVTLTNHSEFSFTLKNWVLEGEKNLEFHFPLPDEEMQSGEQRTFIIPLQRKGGTLRLISPLGRVKDKVLYPDLPSGYILQRNKASSKKDARPEFEEKRRI